METVKYIIFTLLILYDIIQIKTNKTNDITSYILRFLLCLQIEDKYLLLLFLLSLFREFIYYLFNKNENDSIPIINKIIPLPLIIMTIIVLVNFATNLIQIVSCVTVAFSHYYLWFYKKNDKKLHSCNFIVKFIFFIYCCINNIVLLAIEYTFMCCINFYKYKRIYKIKYK